LGRQVRSYGHLGAIEERGDRRILYPFRRELIESGAAIDQCRGHAIRDAELGLIRRLRPALFHDFISGAVSLDPNVTDILDSKTAPQLQRYVDRGMNMAAAGMQFVAVFADLPVPAQAVHHFRRVVSLAHRAKEAAL